MKLSKIEVTNFRCYESLALELQPETNVLVGENGAGKTALMDAIAVALFEVVAANSHGGRVSLWRQRKAQRCAANLSDIHMPRGSAAAVKSRRDFLTVRAEATGFYELPGFPSRTPDGKPVSLEWTEHITHQLPSGFHYESSKSEKLAGIHGYFHELWQEIKRSDSRALIPVPVVAYYRDDRHVGEMPEMKDVFKNPPGIQDAFENALNAGENYEAMCRWFYARENAELREGQQVRDQKDFQYPDLRAVRGAVYRTLEGVKRVFFATDPLSLMAAIARDNGSAEEMSLSQMSSGYRNMLAIVLDFGRRLAQANPRREDPLNAPGILMIDEIEMHLHPRWQQTVIGNLHKVFPKTQLIVATHSPQVLTTVKAENIFCLRDRTVRHPSMNPYAKGSMDALEGIMDVAAAPASVDLTRAFDEYKALVGRGQHATPRAVELRQQLEAEWGSADDSLKTLDVIIRKNEILANAKGA